MSAHDAILALAERHGLDREHPPAVLAEAAAVVAAPGIDDPALEDLTDVPFVTIDEAHSRDLDQALFVAADGGGHRLLYAIADAAYSVRPGSALFAEALARGATYYLPGLTVPMLPRSLSEGVISLNPDVDRRALVFDLLLDGDGALRERRIRRARVRSRLKTTYDAVQAFFDGAPLAGGGPEIEASLEQMRRLGERRLALARARGVVEVRRTEVEVSLSGSPEDDRPLRFIANADPRNDVERWNEQISLLCNVEGARLLREGDRPDDAVLPIYRTHEAPTGKDLEALAEQIDALAEVHGLGAAWRWHPGDEQSLAAFLAGLPRRGAKGRVARAIQRQAMLAAGRSGFAVAPAVHYGVGAEVYGRFTAPMREVVGIYLHREMWDKLGGDGAPIASGDLEAGEALRARVVEAAGRARALQRTLDREANRLVLDQLFERDLRRPEDRRPVRRGTVMGIGYGKVHVQLDSPPIDVKVYLRHLREIRGERVRAGRDDVTVRDGAGRPLWATGGAVGVKVRGRDRDRDRWILALVDLD